MPRVVYSLHFVTERKPSAPIVEFVVTLDREGHSENIRPIGKPRVVDLRPGDWFRHRPTGQRDKIASMSSYRQHCLTNEAIAAGNVPADGYLVHEKRS